MLEKNKIGLVLAVTRRNATPTFCALVPQVDAVLLALPVANLVAYFRQKRWKREDGVNLLDSISSSCPLLMTSVLHPLPKRSEAS